LIEFPAIKYTVSGRDFYLGALPAKDFVPNYEIDAHSQEHPEGYQRYSKMIRSRRFGNFASKYGGFFHQTVLVNVRSLGAVKFTPIQGEFGTLQIQDKLYVVDGQHRVGGIKALLEGDEAAKFSSFPVPVLVMVGSPRQEEAFHFYLVNHTQEGVKAELGDTLLAKVLPPDQLTADFQKEVLGSRDMIPLTRQAVEIAEELNVAPDSVWKGRIAYAQAKLDDQTSITQRGFTQSIKETLRNNITESIFGAENLPDGLVDPLKEYWAAASELCPEATGENFKDYVLMKTTGAYIMHKFFPNVALKCGPSIHQKKMHQILGSIEEMNDEAWAPEGKIGKGGAGHKVYNSWVKRFTSQIAKVKD
jgi:DGQHR domain-containing protein